MKLLRSFIKILLPNSVWKKVKACLRNQLRSLLNDPEKNSRTDWRKHPQVKIGRNTYGLCRETIPIMDCPNWSVEVGNFCSIAPGVRFVFGLHHMECPTTFPIREHLRNDWRMDLWKPESISIGHDVWIASNALILSGVSVGHGSIICAGAVVSRDIPPYSIAAGIPARVIRCRMTQESIEQMLAIAWWDWSDSKILANESMFYGDIESFIKAHWLPTKQTLI